MATESTPCTYRRKTMLFTLTSAFSNTYWNPFSLKSSNNCPSTLWTALSTQFFRPKSRPLSRKNARPYDNSYTKHWTWTICKVINHRTWSTLTRTLSIILRNNCGTHVKTWMSIKRMRIANLKSLYFCKRIRANCSAKWLVTSMRNAKSKKLLSSSCRRSSSVSTLKRKSK